MAVMETVTPDRPHTLGVTRVRVDPRITDHTNPQYFIYF